MSGVGTLVLYMAAALLCSYALYRHDGSLRRGMKRGSEQILCLLPRMVCALIAAGFIVQLIPGNFIGGLLGAEAGYSAIFIGSLAGTMVPAGPVVAMAVAAAFADQGASIPALVSFLTGWGTFAAHRILMFEIPLLGLLFVRLRLIAVLLLPFLAGTIAAFATSLFDMPAD